MMIKTIILASLLPFSSWASTLPQQLAVPGGVVHIKVGSSLQPAPKVSFQNEPVLVMKQNQQWIALVGIPLKTKADVYSVNIYTANGEVNQKSFNVGIKNYEAQYITIKNKRKVNPNPKDLERIKKERIPLSKALNTWTKQPVTEINFSLPVDGRLSSRFGLRRFFNNQPKNPHSGLDIAAPSGTPIKAPVSGKVLETGRFFYNGNTVLLDHGQGLITGYFHMTKTQVKKGQIVQRGDILGTVGETGRVTGPHLHWNVYLNRTKVDPALFIPEAIAQLESRHSPKKSLATTQKIRPYFVTKDRKPAIKPIIIAEKPKAPPKPVIEIKGQIDSTGRYNHNLFLMEQPTR